MKACGNRVIVELPNQNEVTSPGGIVLTAKQKGLVCGRVVSVGPGRTDQENAPCLPDEMVYFNRAEYETVIDKTEESVYIVLEFGQILAVK